VRLGNRDCCRQGKPLFRAILRDRSAQTIEQTPLLGNSERLGGPYYPRGNPECGRVRDRH
jgi:hypothetical protein